MSSDGIGSFVGSGGARIGREGVADASAGKAEGGKPNRERNRRRKT